MVQNYDVSYRGDSVGGVKVRKEGLYCRIVCRCRLPDGKIHRLYADGENIGVLIPDGGELVLDTKVAAKRLKEGCSFSLDEKRGEFIPIRSGEPFDYLGKVRLGKLAFRDGDPGLYLDA